MQRYFLSIFRTLLQGGVPVGVSFVLGNYLAVAQYGEYVSLTLLISTVVIVSTIPVDSAIIHFILKQKSIREQNSFYSSGCFLVIVNTIFVLVVLLLFKSSILKTFNILNIDNYGYAIVVLCIISMIIYLFFSKIMTVNYLFKEQVIYLLVSSIFQITIIGYLILVEIDNILFFVFSVFIFYIVGIILYAHRLNKEFKISRDFTKNKHIKPILKFSSIVYIGALTGFLDEKIDLLCINMMLDKEQLAYYNYAIIVGFVLYGVGLGVSQVTFPHFCRYLQNNDFKQCELMYERTIKYLFVFISFIGILLLFNSEEIFELLLPPDYVAMLPALNIIIPGIILFSVFAGVGTLFTAAGKPQCGLWIISGFMIVNLVLNLILIPKWGIIGAAAATSSTFFARSFVIHWLSRFVIGLNCRIASVVYCYFIMIALVVVGRYLPIMMREITAVIFFLGSAWFLSEKEERNMLFNFLIKKTKAYWN